MLNPLFLHAPTSLAAPVPARLQRKKSRFTGSLSKVVIATTAALCMANGFAAGAYSIGSYYYPGWKADTTVVPPTDPWQRIYAYPDREPLLGWYKEGDTAVMDQQLRWMSDYGLDFVVFDWYWTSNRPRNEHALNAYMLAPNKSLVKFAIMWANHENYPKSEENFRSIAQYWVNTYLKDPQYKRINNQPVVYIYSPSDLESKAKAFGSSTLALINQANVIAQQAGLPNIYFVAGTAAGTFAQGPVKTFGYQAMSAYNYGLGRSFAERDAGYQRQWKDILATAPIPYMPNMTSGWDKRPWGGTPNDPGRDLAFSTPDSFEAHLRSVKETMDLNPDTTLRTGVICCWNEFGEGSYIEPTKKFGTQYLERVKKVFSQ
ncbi:MAG: glycoside hydrolase family 99-like domain-containing protein [Ferruginibacter sp.]|nr:glycoside hydrolase family 99-like domain-containing protein [Rhodoferax sp.]